MSCRHQEWKHGLGKEWSQRPVVLGVLEGHLSTIAQGGGKVSLGARDRVLFNANEPVKYCGEHIYMLRLPAPVRDAIMAKNRMGII